MKITIVNIKFLEKIARATVKNESNAVFENTTIFANFPNYSNLKDGDIIEGELVQNDYNGKTGWKINAPRVGGAGKGNAGIAAAVEKKNKAIGEFQDKKEASIEKMATFRDATMLTVAWASHIPAEDFSTATMKDKWVEFRLWLEGQLEELPFN